MAKNKTLKTSGVITLEDQVRSLFTNLKVGDMEITSDQDRSYNCIAWAMGDSSQFWWPSPDTFWPEGVPRQVTVEAFSQAFRTVGFQPCTDGEHQDGKEKVALYTLAGAPTHACFLTERGTWASKLGSHHDIEHKTLECLGGAPYGQATHFFSRDLPANPRPKMPNVIFEKAKTLEMTNETQGRLRKLGSAGTRVASKRSSNKPKQEH